ncbi:GGDEF domain-containing protein [Rhizobium sp. RAF56]|uniref:GGDEF domain-containing protein n=1 Tax=Rhizobium sp. RAF56 TaxID=3233062 RepID=UPI003F948E42
MIPAISVAREKLASSLALKVLAICIAATNIPLLVLVLSLWAKYAGTSLPLMPLMLVATLLGTALCLVSVWQLIRPLHRIAATIENYRDNGEVLSVACKRTDTSGAAVNGVAKLIVELDATLSQLRRQATTDVLTGLGNRRWLSDLGTMEVARAIREKSSLSVVVLDLDFFKTINDEFGHDVGDQVLMMTGMTIQNGLRPYDIAARIGGEEFCVVLPGANLEQATNIAERLRIDLSARSVGPIPAGRVTASFGVYQGDPENETLKTMMTAADELLYAAKHSGRNQVLASAVPRSANVTVPEQSERTAG